jgi:hypothetical protein
MTTTTTVDKPQEIGGGKNMGKHLRMDDWWWRNDDDDGRAAQRRQKTTTGDEQMTVNVRNRV